MTLKFAPSGPSVPVFAPADADFGQFQCFSLLTFFNKKKKEQQDEKTKHGRTKPEEWEAQNFAFFFFPSPATFSFFLKTVGASHDSPRAQTCTFQGPGRQLNEKTPREVEKERNGGGRGKKKKEQNFGRSSGGGSSVRCFFFPRTERSKNVKCDRKPTRSGSLHQPGDAEILLHIVLSWSVTISATCSRQLQHGGRDCASSGTGQQYTPPETPSLLDPLAQQWILTTNLGSGQQRQEHPRLFRPPASDFYGEDNQLGTGSSTQQLGVCAFLPMAGGLHKVESCGEGGHPR